MKKLLILCCILWSMAVYAQTENDQEINFLFKETVRINSKQTFISPPLTFWTLYKTPTYRSYILVLDPTINFFIFTGTKTKNTLLLSMANESRVNWSRGYSPKYDSRTFWNQSFPVRTPSYKPSITYFFERRSKKKEDRWKRIYQQNKSRSISGKETKEYRHHYYSMSVYHHSNGQDATNSEAAQYRYLSSAQKDWEERYMLTNGVSRQAANQAFLIENPTSNYDTYKRYMNIYNGNFGINLGVEAGVTFSRFRFYSTDDLSKSISNRTLYFGMNSGQLTTPLVDLGEASLVGVYGLEKLVFRYQNIIGKRDNETNKKSIFEKHRFVINGSLALNKFIKTNLYSPTFKNKINIDFKYQWSGANAAKYRVNSNSISYFVGVGYKGQDDYNVYFEDSFFFIQAGIALGNKLHVDASEYTIKRNIFGL